MQELPAEPPTIVFSVIMPVWNQSRLVTKAVESVLAQTFGDWELVIVDDGSNDDLAGRFAPYFCDRVKLRRTPHCGVSAACNAGLHTSTEPLGACLDSDNTRRPCFL